MVSAASSLRFSLGALAWGVAFAVQNPGYNNGSRLEFEERVPGFGGGTEGFPDSEDYLTQRVVPPALPGFALALLFFLYLVLFLVVRSCAACLCIGKCCSCFCGTVTIDKADRKPSRCKRTTQFLALLFAIAICVPACGIAFAGAKEVSDGVTDLADVMEAEVRQTQSMAALADSVAEAFDTNLETRLEPLVADVRSSVDEVIDIIRGGLESDWRMPVLYSFYSFFLVVPLLGVLAYCCQRGCLAVLMTGLALLALTITWAVFGASFLTAIVVNDTCLEVTKFYNFQPNAVPANWCIEPDKAREMYLETHQQVAASLDTYETLSMTPEITKLSAFGLDNGTVGSSRFALNREWRYDVRRDLGVETSSSEDYSPTVVNNSAGCIPFTGTVTDETCLKQAIATGADGLTASSFVGSCFYVSSLAEKIVPEGGLCTDTLHGFVLLFVAHGLIGFACTIMLCVGLRAQQDWQDWSKERELPPTTSV